MSRIELANNSEFIVLASRFEVNESGHFYWFTKSLQRELINNQVPFKILARDFPESSQKQFQDWKILPTKAEWGKDTGTISPLKLANLIEKEILSKSKRESRTLVYTYETSFSLLAALIIILFRNPNITAAANMLDTGYWHRFFNWKFLSWAPLQSTIKFALKFVDKRLMFYANMPSEAAVISNQISYPVNSFPHITALNPAEYTKDDSLITAPEENLPKILIFTWPGDLPFVCMILNQMSRRSPILLPQVTVHTKKFADEQFITEYLTREGIVGVNLVTGTLSQEEYINLIRQSDATLFPYADKMHFSTGSGRVIDSLILGRPVILNAESGSCLHAQKVNACFTYEGDNPTSVLEAIEGFRSSPFFSKNSSGEYQETLKSAAALEFSIGGLLNSIVSESRERMAYTKMHQHPRKIKFIPAITLLEIVWIALNAYHKISPVMKRMLKFVLP